MVDQSEHIALFRSREFTETGTKQSVTDRPEERWENNVNYMFFFLTFKHEK